MKTILLLIVLSAVSAFAQKNMYEAKWGSQGNGGGTFTSLLMQPMVDPSDVPQACIYGPLKVVSPDGLASWELGKSGYACIKGARGPLHAADFGGGPFLFNDEGYVYLLPFRWSSNRAIRTFTNGVH